MPTPPALPSAVTVARATLTGPIASADARASMDAGPLRGSRALIAPVLAPDLWVVCDRTTDGGESWGLVWRGGGFAGVDGVTIPLPCRPTPEPLAAATGRTTRELDALEEADEDAYAALVDDALELAAIAWTDEVMAWSADAMRLEPTEGYQLVLQAIAAGYDEHQDGALAIWLWPRAAAAVTAEVERLRETPLPYDRAIGLRQPATASPPAGAVSRTTARPVDGLPRGVDGPRGATRA